jgi:hypothetical protein
MSGFVKESWFRIPVPVRLRMRIEEGFAFEVDLMFIARCLRIAFCSFRAVHAHQNRGRGTWFQ